jgi:hypothetical protein
MRERRKERKNETRKNSNMYYLQQKCIEIYHVNIFLLFKGVKRGGISRK